MSLWTNKWINPWDAWLQHKTLIFSTLHPILNCRYQTQKQCSWWLYKYLRTLLVSYLPSTLDKYFSGVLKMIISNEFCRRVSWGEEELLFYPFLQTKLTTIFSFDHENFLLFDGIMCLLIWDICDNNSLSLRTTNSNVACHLKIFGFFNITLKITFYDNKICILLNHILFLQIHLHEYLTLKMVYITYEKNVIIVHRYTISLNCIMKPSETHFFCYIY